LETASKNIGGSKNKGERWGGLFLKNTGHADWYRSGEPLGRGTPWDRTTEKNAPLKKATAGATGRGKGGYGLPPPGLGRWGRAKGGKALHEKRLSFQREKSKTLGLPQPGLKHDTD